MELFWLANYRCKTHFSSHSWQMICKKVNPEEFPFTNLLQFLSSFFPWFLYSEVQRVGLDLCRLKHEMSDFCKESCIYEICTDIFPLQYKKTKKEKKTKRLKGQKRHNTLFLQHLSRRLKIHSIRAWRTWSWVSSRLVPFGEPLCSRIPALAKILSNARKYCTSARREG